MQAAENKDPHIAADNAYDLLLQDRKCEEGSRRKLDARWWGTLDLLDVVSGKDRGTTAITHDGDRNNSSASDSDIFATNESQLMFVIILRRYSPRES